MSADPLPTGPLPDGLDPDRADPVRWIVLDSGAGYWSVADHELARRVLGDARFSRAAAVGAGSTRLTALSPSADSIISMDGERHTRLRRLVAGAFTDRAVARYAPAIAEDVEGLLDGLVARGRPADLVDALTSRLPLTVLCRVLGVPVADSEEFRTLVPVLFDIDGDETDTRRRGYRLVQYMARLVASRRADPGDDVLSGLMTAHDDDRLSSRELVNLGLALLMAGYDTTADQLALTVLAMLTHRERWVAACADPGVVAGQVEELLALTPATPIAFTRVALDDVELGDVLVRRDEPLVVFAMGANRCPAAQGTPTSRHLTFGHGAHRCVGAPLARLQLVTAVTALTRRLPGLTLAEAPDALPWKPAGATRGLTRLLVTW